METHSEDRILFHFNVEKPIEVSELTKALSGIAGFYERAVKHVSSSRELGKEDYRLYVTQIEKNCVLCELAGYAGLALPSIGYLEYAKTFSELAHSLCKLIAWFARLQNEIEDEPSVPPTRQETIDLKHILDLASPESHSGQADFSFTRKKYFPDGSTHSEEVVKFNQAAIIKAKEGTKHHLAKLDAEQIELREGVILEIAVIDRKRSKSTEKSYDRGVIAEVSSKEVIVSWMSEMDGIRVKDPETTLAQMECLVDVQIVRNSKEIPKIYRVLRVIEIMDAEDNA